MTDSIPEFKKTILVGLGGAGKMILTHLKKQFIDMYRVVPPSVKFLSLDTDPAPVSLRSADGSRTITLEDREFLYMNVEQPIEFIENSGINEWFIKPLPTGSIDRGAHAVREVGRVAFFYHLPEFLKRINRMLTLLSDQRLHVIMENANSELGANTNFKLSVQNPEIYICGSLAGGTGSGTFIDVSLLMRHEFKNALIHGFFLLNWIYRNKAFAYRVHGNVYAALCELDNLQSIAYGDRHFVPYAVNYPDLRLSVDKSPFDLVHLIDGRNEFGENIHEIDQLCQTTATAIFLSVSAMGDAVASVVDNLLAHVNASPRQLWNGRYPRYSSFGLSSLYYPAEELHRFLYHREAEKLCAMALAEVQSIAADQQQYEKQGEVIAGNVDQFLGTNQLNILNRDFVRDNLCPFTTPVDFTVQPFQISDSGFPGALEFQLEQEQNDINKQLNDKKETDGHAFLNDTVDAIKLKIDAIRKDPTCDSVYLKRWIEAVVDRLNALKEAATKDRNREDDHMRDFMINGGNLKEIALQSRYLPIIGGGRKKAVTSWAEVIVDYLTAMKDKFRYDCEVDFYDEIIKIIKSLSPSWTKEDSEVAGDLEKIRETLHELFFRENENLKLLKSTSNQLLVGNGNTVVISGNAEGLNIMDAITLDYHQFKKDTRIHNPEDYLMFAKEKGIEPEMLFLNYSAEKLNHLKKITVLEALSCIGKNRGNQESYITDQFNHLFRLSSALWRFNKSRLNLQQRNHYDNIVNFGVREQSEGRANYDNYVDKVKARYQIRADHTFSTTGDPHRIWMLNFAAALPAYFLTELENSRQKYLNEMNPPYHIDQDFEMNVPDLFPTSDTANKALRAIGMAIVPGIDVIRDEKLKKGHKFTFDDPAYTGEKNFGMPFEWFLFRDMYDDIVSLYDDRRQDNMLDALINLLTQKVSSMSTKELHETITRYVLEVENKLANRDFSRLISAQLTHREIKELKTFLNPRGYGMDIKKYIEGKLI